jgi:hypothetical protein
MTVLQPNPALHSDPACIAFRSLSTSCYLGFVHRLGAGGAGELLPLGRSHGIFMIQRFKLWSMILLLICASVTLASQCPDTGETKVIKPNEGTGYYFYRLIGIHSFQYFLDGKEFSFNSKDDPERTYTFIDKMAFEVVLVNKASFGKFIKKDTHQGILEAQAKYEQAYFKKIFKKVRITSLGEYWRPDAKGNPERLFLFWKKDSPSKSGTATQYLLSTMLDDDVVVVLSIIPLAGSTEADVFEQAKNYTGHFDLLTAEQYSRLPSAP